MKIEDALALVRAATPLTSENYPQRPSQNRDASVAFDLAHALVHGQKASGIIAGHVERFDHGDERAFDGREVAQLQLAATKLVWNALGMCSALGMSEANIVKQFQLIAERG